MKKVVDELESLLTNADRFRRIDEATAAAKPAPGKWSMKETLGVVHMRHHLEAIP